MNPADGTLPQVVPVGAGSLRETAPGLDALFHHAQALRRVPVDIGAAALPYALVVHLHFDLPERAIFLVEPLDYLHVCTLPSADCRAFLAMIPHAPQRCTYVRPCRIDITPGAYYHLPRGARLREGAIPPCRAASRLGRVRLRRSETVMIPRVFSSAYGALREGRLLFLFAFFVIFPALAL